ncbi:MAG: cyclic nucleotide-binding domain-containing protein [Bacteriovorax sp.]
MKKQNSIKLENTVIAEILKHSPQKKFQVEAPLFYEGQIPIVAYLIIEGGISLFKKKKPRKTLKAGSLLGLKELLNNSPAELSAKVQADSTICFLDKSTIQEILHKENSLLALLLKEGEL